jgi:hypothetical protein
VFGSSNILIEGPGTITNFARGIGVVGSKNVAITGVKIKDNSRGIHVSRRGLSNPPPASNDVTISNTKIEESQNRDGSTSGGQGIGVFSFNDPVDPIEVTENIHIVSVEVEDSERTGILFSGFPDPAHTGSRYLVEDCKVKKNGSGIAVLVGSDVTVRDCEITDNLSEAIILGTFPGASVSQVKIRDSYIADNGIGLNMGGTNNIQDDVKLRSTIFESNGRDCINNSSPMVDIIELNNVFDSSSCSQ